MKELFILGAGASYGSSFSLDEKTPMIGNFFEKAFECIGDRYDFFLDYLKKEYNLSENILLSNNMNFEELYSYLDAESKINLIGNNYKEYPEFNVNPPIYYLESLVYETILFYNFKVKDKTCEFHDSLARYIMNSDSKIISLNYDCIIDKSLKEQTNWQENGGYGLYRTNLNNIENIPTSKSKLFKIHGSLNWRWSDDNGFQFSFINLEDFFDNYKEHPAIPELYEAKEYGILNELNYRNNKYPKQGNPAIIFPTQYKDFNLLNNLIKSLEIFLSDAIYNVNKIVIIGAYLLNDLHIISLLTKFLKQNNAMIEIELINPMEEDDLKTWINKARTFFPNASKISRTYNTFGEYASNCL